MWRGLIVAFWLLSTPAFGQNASLIYTDDDAVLLKSKLLSDADTKVRRFFADEFDQVLENPIILVGTSDPELLNLHLNKALGGLGRRQRTSPVDASQLCVGKEIGAAANRPYILMCWKKPDVYDARWVAKTSLRLSPILAHEFFHQLQYHLAQDDPVQRIEGTNEILFGPSWLVEGSAEVFENLYILREQPNGRVDDAAQTLFNMQSPARRSRLTLAELTQAQSTKGRAGYGTARFAAFLLSQRSGPDALFRYFEVLGDAKDRDIAFEQVFGLSFETFYADFERVRRDFTAATEYASGGTQ